MENKNKVISIVAYYLSEFDMDAVNALGYKTRVEAISDISKKLDKDNNYLKLRRDEFDALPTSSSTRKGWRNRPPSKTVLDLAQHLKMFSFIDLTEIVKSILTNKFEGIVEINSKEWIPKNVLTEIEIENIINFTDTSASIDIKMEQNKVRRYNRKIITSLKKLYKGQCQICGCAPFPDVDVSEAHHIEYFLKSVNNDSDNILILCPNHHRLIHRLNPSFDINDMKYVFDDGSTMYLKINYHLDSRLE